MRNLVKCNFRKFYFYGVGDGLIHHLKNVLRLILWHFKRNFGRVDSEIVGNYLAEQEVRKLHIGCGENILSGWLNADFFPHSDMILHLDASDTFPFPTGSFDYIFSEHMIEHISYSNGFVMLSECYRILRNNGKVRISTPNMQFLINLYGCGKSELQMEYLKWATDKFGKNISCHDDTFVINNFVRAWGHLFIYDEKTLRSSLGKAGFSKIVRCDLNESNDELLRNLENDQRMPKGLLKLESFTLEGTKRLAS